MSKLVKKLFKKKTKSLSEKKSEFDYKVIFNSVNDALFIHDIKTGEILDVNKKCVRYMATRARKLWLVMLA